MFTNMTMFTKMMMFTNMTMFTNMMFTSFISHDNNNGVRSGSLGVEDSDRDEVLSEHGQLLQGVALVKMAVLKMTLMEM